MSFWSVSFFAYYKQSCLKRSYLHEYSLSFLLGKFPGMESLRYTLCVCLVLYAKSFSEVVIPFCILIGHALRISGISGFLQILAVLLWSVFLILALLISVVLIHCGFNFCFSNVWWSWGSFHVCSCHLCIIDSEVPV